MRLENIPTQHRVELSPYGIPTLSFIKGGIVIHSDLKPCLVVEVNVALTAKQRTEGFANIFLKEIGTRERFQPLWKNIKTHGKDLTTYSEFTKGTKLTVECVHFIQPYHMTVAEDVKAPNKDGYFSIKAQQRVFAGDGPTSEDAFTEILTLSLAGLLTNPKINKTLTGRTGKEKVYTNGGWPTGRGCTTGSHTNPNPKPNPLANPSSFYTYGYIIK